MIKYVVICSIVYSVRLYASETSVQNEGNTDRSQWYVTRSYTLPEPQAFGLTRANNEYISHVFALVPDTWDYRTNGTAYLPRLDALRYHKPKPVPYITWTSTESPESWTGYVQVVNHSIQPEYFRLRSPCSCIRINGKYRAQSFEAPPGGTNILVTYLPQLHQTNDVQMEIVLTDDEQTRTSFAINFENVEYDDAAYSGVEDTAILRWHSVESLYESPAAIPQRNNSLICAHRTWYSPEEQDAILRIGCDDAIRVWHNGTLVFESARLQGYIRERYGVKVRLNEGDNHFMCVLVNGPGATQIGLRLYPMTHPLDDSLVLNATHAYADRTPIYSGYPVEKEHTSSVILIDYMWASVTNTPLTKALRTIDPLQDQWHVAPIVSEIKPPCDEMSIVRMTDNTRIFHAKNITTFPVRIDMSPYTPGVYRCDAYFNGRLQSRYFYYADGEQDLCLTGQLLLYLARRENFYEPSILYDLLSNVLDDSMHSATGAVRMIRGFTSSRDGTIQPYYLRIPAHYVGVSGAPVIIHLQMALPTSIEDWNRYILRPDMHISGEESAILAVPYARGNRVYSGLAEGDVLDILQDVYELTEADADRVYLTGDSLGGDGCWLLGGRYPDRFAAIAPRSAQPSDNWHNLLALPVWHIQGEYDAPERVKAVIDSLARRGADAHITIEDGKLHTEHSFDAIENILKWLQHKRRNITPAQFVYTTYGDIDSVYWLRDIRPKRYGQRGYVEAQWQTTSTGGYMNILTDNIASYDIDLRHTAFLTSDVWTITVNETETYTASASNVVHILLTDNPRSKRQSHNSGGIAQITDHGFVISYATGNAYSNDAKRIARQLQNDLMGRGTWQYDTYIDVIPDSEIATVENKNIILCISTKIIGEYLSQHQCERPFDVEGDMFSLGARKGRFMACVMPRPDAHSNLLLVIADVEIPVHILQNIRKDVVLGYHIGSFDGMWERIYWDDAPVSMPLRNRPVAHEAALMGESALKRIGRIIFVICVVAGVVYFLMCRRKENLRHVNGER